MAAKRPKEEDRHTGRMLGVWMPLENHAALDVIAAKEYRSKSAIVMRALGEYCKKRSHEWPSAEQELGASASGSGSSMGKVASANKPSSVGKPTGKTGSKPVSKVAGDLKSGALPGKIGKGPRKRN